MEDFGSPAIPFVCALAGAGAANITPATAKTTSRNPGILIASLLFSRFVAAIAGKVKKPVLRVFAAVDVGVWGFAIRDMQIRHARSLPAQLISDQCETRPVESGPYLLDLIRILAGYRARLPQRQ